MRLLIVTPEFAPHAGGGIVRYYGTIAPALVRAGADVTVIVAAPFADGFDDYQTEGVRVVSVPRSAIVSAEGGLSRFSAAPEWRRWLATAWAGWRAAGELGPFDVVETTDFGLGFAPFLIEPGGAPVVVRCHGSLGQISEHEPRHAPFELDRALARLAEATLLVRAGDLQTYAQANASEWVRRLGRPVAVVRPALPLPEVGPAREDFGLVVGRVQSWKGPDLMCRALRHLPVGACPPVRWAGRDTRTAEGGGSLAADLKRRYPDVWGSRIEWLGPLAFEAAGKLIARARFVVVPSAWDVFNFTAVEAMASGKVVVCSSGAGASDLITSGENGFVFGAGDTAALARAIEVAASLPETEARRMGDAARETAARMLDPARAAAAHLDRYRSVPAAGDRCPDWLAGFFRPDDAGAAVGLDFLDQMSISSVAAYLAGRLRRRIGDSQPGAGR